MKMHCLSGGRVRMRKSVYVPDADRSEMIEMPVASMLLRHPRGNVLFDTGCHPAVLDNPAHWQGMEKFMTPIMPPGDNVLTGLTCVGLTPDDIDVAMIYENFTPIVFIQLEAFGFCGPGEATDFIAGGNIEVGGKIPVNPNGGLLGEAYIHGMNNILEGVRQVRGSAANQVDHAEHVLVSAGRSGLVLSP